MIRRPPRSTLMRSSAASDVYKRQGINAEYGTFVLKNTTMNFSRAFLTRELTHVWPFAVGFGLMTAGMMSIKTPKEERASSDYAKQLDAFWDKEKTAQIFDHSSHGAHDSHDAKPAQSEIANVTDYINK
eukprot:TRINITY_DN1214_c0_g2_i1.p1 TRINITY_DN1214_c0_g2~~TRINITY_DN1214_c0_g2_i1.p1  ORF type:complete len:129 (+),score=42.13 TRINITY_DN1214_c0_g2_i1:2-388(+)